jgi:hypothetical protein
LIGTLDWNIIQAPWQQNLVPKKLSCDDEIKTIERRCNVHQGIFIKYGAAIDQRETRLSRILEKETRLSRASFGTVVCGGWYHTAE